MSYNSYIQRKQTSLGAYTMSNTNTAQTFTEWYTVVRANLKATYQPLINEGLLTTAQVDSILTAHCEGARLTWLHLVGTV